MEETTWRDDTFTIYAAGQIANSILDRDLRTSICGNASLSLVERACADFLGLGSVFGEFLQHNTSVVSPRYLL